jgi:type II secretory ATPase GspE/PulE/Tfp pilus assembly ATPase PilB-like protein
MIASLGNQIDIVSVAARWWLYAAVAAVLVVVASVLSVLLAPAFGKLRDRIFGKKADPDVPNIDAYIESQGRSLAALASVRRAVQEMSENGRSATRDLVDYTIAQAWNLGASDMHVTPSGDGMTLQLRIDGLLYDLASFSAGVHESVIIRLKVLSKLNVYKRDIPQDGRILIEAGQNIDIRLSTLPTIHGEKAVLRVLTRAGRILEVSDLGFEPSTLERYEELIARPQGMILVTGPTGHGKTTTLYASLKAVKQRRGSNLNIVTIEDPVEYKLPFLNQTQVNEAVGLTFASGLRSVLRQDPNIIMVGEIRDAETAEIAMHAGLTGHLMFSTIHAESSPGVFTRLLNMKVEPFILASAISGVLSQRLVRKLCVHCRQEVEPSPHEIEQLGKLGVGFDGESGPFFRSVGCERCFEMGVRGRTGLFELMVVHDALQEELVKEVRTRELHDRAIEGGMVPLLDDGLAKARAGVISLEELLTVMTVT